MSGVPPRPVLAVDDIDLTDTEFWARPWDEREGAFQTLRRERPMPFYPEPEIPEALAFAIPEGHGYYALTRHAHISEASRHPEVYLSGPGATSIVDLPAEMLDFFGSMINMDNPRHARLRRIVSAAFNPRMIKSIEERIERVADEVIDRVAPLGGCDFTVEVAARLPLEIICGMMGVGPSDYDTVFNSSNVILSNGDAEYVPEGADPMVAFMTAAQQLNMLMLDLAAYRREHPTEDVTSALVNTNVDGEELTDAEVASFFILLVVAGNETTRNAISHGLLALTEHPGPANVPCGWRTCGCRADGDRRDRSLGHARDLDEAHRGHRYGAGRDRAARGRQGHHVLQLGEPRRGSVRRPLHLRRPAHAEPPYRLRRGRPSLLPGRTSGSPGDRRDVPAPLRPPARHSWLSARAGLACCRRSSTQTQAHGVHLQSPAPRRAEPLAPGLPPPRRAPASPARHRRAGGGGEEVRRRPRRLAGGPGQTPSTDSSPSSRCCSSSVTIAGIVLGIDPAAEERAAPGAVPSSRSSATSWRENISALRQGEPDRLRGQLRRPAVGLSRRG